MRKETEAQAYIEVGDIDTQIIAASVRTTMHVTDAGIAKFVADYKAVFGE